MANVNRLLELRQELDNLRRALDRAEGALERDKQELKSRFDCDNIEEAEKLLKRLTAKEIKLNKTFTEALAKFEKDWGESLNKYGA